MQYNFAALQQKPMFHTPHTRLAHAGGTSRILVSFQGRLRIGRMPMAADTKPTPVAADMFRLRPQSVERGADTASTRIARCCSVPG